ncbi:S-adenosyl-L-methionine-dependent methyltransferase [Mycena sp. CBHHK59/15]|nr:S-adenosyl-L-methionine-dependent methyltransferase [Mycena sp. CBHHK59/15]
MCTAHTFLAHRRKFRRIRLSSFSPNILDVGCGPGTMTTSFAKLVPDGHVTGIERSTEDVLQRARKSAAAQGVSNIAFAIGDVLALNFPDDSFDVVHAHQVLHHVPDPVLALREIIRVTKPGESSPSARPTFPPWRGIRTTAGYPSSMKRISRSHTRTAGGQPDAGCCLLSWLSRLAFHKGQDHSNLQHLVLQHSGGSGVVELFLGRRRCSLVWIRLASARTRIRDAGDVG